MAPLIASCRVTPTASSRLKSGGRCRRVVARCCAGNDVPATTRKKGESSQGSEGGVRLTMPDIPDNSYYAVLRVSRLATEVEIKSKYRELSKLYHPDTTSLPEAQAAAKFMELREAYETLSDESKRNYYDWKLTMQALEAARNGARASPVSERGKGPVTNRESGSFSEGGGKVPLSGQAQTALAFDLFAFLVCWFEFCTAAGLTITVLLLTKGNA